MTWFIDAMNVVGARPDGWWRDRPAAVRRLAAACGARRDEFDATSVVLVVDGPPDPELPAGEHHGIVVEYARHRGPDAADERIVELLGAIADPSHCRVVTADRGLIGQIEALGAAVESPSHFRRWLEGPAEPLT